MDHESAVHARMHWCDICNKRTTPEQHLNGSAKLEFVYLSKKLSIGVWCNAHTSCLEGYNGSRA